MDVGRRNLVVLFVSNLIASTGMSGFLPAFPIILPRMGVTDPAAVAFWSGTLFAAAPFSAAIAGPLWGALGDRVGRKAMVLRALLAITVFVGAMAFVTSPLQMLALRLAQGVFSGFIAPSLTLVSVHTRPDRQGSVAAAMQGALLAGAVIGPPIGGFVLDHGSPPLLFATAAAGALLSAALVAWLAREEVRVTPPPPGSRVLATLSASWRDVGQTFRMRGVRRVLIAIFAVRFGTACVEPVFATYSKQFESTSAFVAQYHGLANGALVAAASLGNLLMLPVWGRRGDRKGHRRALVMASLGAGLFYAPQAFAPEVWSLFVIRFFAGAFMAGTIPSAYGMVADATPVERRGSSFSLTFSALALANALAPFAGGAASAAVGVRPLLVFSAVPMLAAALWVSTWRDERR